MELKFVPGGFRGLDVPALAGESIRTFNTLNNSYTAAGLKPGPKPSDGAV